VQRTGFDPDALRADFDPQTAGIRLNNYIAAMSNELEELGPERIQGRRGLNMAVT